jgi:hypothetical protein
MNRIAPITAILLSLLMPRPVGGRLAQPWSYQELFDKSDFVVIAKVSDATRDTAERSNLPDVQAPDSLPVIGVVTEFQTRLVLKGTKLERFILHHCRLSESEVAIINGPSFMSFDPKKSPRAYLLFLVREPDGRFAPVAGQTDLDISVLELRGIAD